MIHLCRYPAPAVASLRMLLTGLQCTSMANATFIVSINPVFCAVVER